MSSSSRKQSCWDSAVCYAFWGTNLFHALPCYAFPLASVQSTNTLYKWQGHVKIKKPKKKTEVLSTAAVYLLHIAFPSIWNLSLNEELRFTEQKNNNPSIELPKLQTTSPMSHHALGVVLVLSFVALKPPAPWQFKYLLGISNNLVVTTWLCSNEPGKQHRYQNTSNSNWIEVTSHSWFRNLLWTLMMQIVVS